MNIAHDMMSWLLCLGYVVLLIFVDLSFHFRKIIICYRRVGYKLNVMRQSACLVFTSWVIQLRMGLFESFLCTCK